MNQLPHFFPGIAEIRNHAQRQRHPRAVLPLVLAGVIVAAAGCGSQQIPVSASSSSGQNPTSQSELFTVAPEQMSHIHIITVAPTRLDRMLRLTGAVAYNAFQTTPVISQAGGPVSRTATTDSNPVNASRPSLVPSCRSA